MAVPLEPKFDGDFDYLEFNALRVAIARAKGKNLPKETFCWAYDECLICLRNRSRALSLHDMTFEHITDSTDTVVLFDSEAKQAKTV